MTTNVGKADRAVRFLIGLVLILAAAWGWYYTTFAPWISITGLVVGVILVLTAYLRYCPAYGTIGMSTR